MSGSKTSSSYISSLTGPRPNGLGLGEHLVSNKSRTFYHLKGVISEEKKKGLQEAAKTVKTYNLRQDSTYAYADACLGKSTLLRLSILLRNASSTSIFPNLELLYITKPLSFDLFPFLLSSTISGLVVGDWDFTNRLGANNDPSKMLLENDLIQFLKTLSNTVQKMNFITISKSASPRLLHCVPAFAGLRVLSIVDIKLSGRPDMVECIFAVISKLSNPEDLIFNILDSDATITLNNTPPHPHPLTLKYAALALTNAVFKAFGRYFNLTAIPFLQFSFVGEAAGGTPAFEKQLVDFTEFVDDFLLKSPPPNFTLRGSNVWVPTPPPIPRKLLNQLLTRQALESLHFDYWRLDEDQITQTFNNAAVECKAQPPGRRRPLTRFEIGECCQWKGLPLRALSSLALVFPGLKCLRCAIRLEPPPSPSGWDTTQLDGADECPLTEIVVFDPNPYRAGPRLDIQDLVAITKYLKKVFPKLKVIKCKTKQEEWSLVKDLLEMATSR